MHGDPIETMGEEPLATLGHVEIRPMTAADCGRLAAFTAALSPETPPIRFVAPGLAAPATHDTVPVPLLAVAAGRVLGAARFARPRHGPGVEAAFAVAADVDRHGMAVELIERMVGGAFESGLLRTAAAADIAEHATRAGIVATAIG